MAIFAGNSGNSRDWGALLALFLAVVLGCNMIGCTKPDQEIIPRVDTPLPAPTIPTGIIKTFTITDSLIGYDYQTIIKWSVTEANTKTVVTLNGVKVNLDGSMQSGHLITNTTFTLAVNSGKSVIKQVTVADPLTTYLWNDGKRWRPVDFYTYNKNLKMIGSQGQDSTYADWEAVYNRDSARYSHMRMSFYLDGNTKEEQLSTSYPKPPPSGKILVQPSNNGKYVFNWKNTSYTVDSLSSKILIMLFDSTQNTSVTLKNRIHLVPEF